MNPKGFVLLCCIVYLLDLIIGRFKGLKGNGINNTPLVMLPITPTTGEGAMVRMRQSLDGMGLQPESNHSIFFLHISQHGAVARLGADPRKIAQIHGVEVRHIPFPHLIGPLSHAHTL